MHYVNSILTILSYFIHVGGGGINTIINFDNNVSNNNNNDNNKNNDLVNN